ncbi:MAG: hypothetical protein IJI75_03310 [Solobacterium sp.]|nr:hypothetical protein [Solobacterium sp.]
MIKLCDQTGKFIRTIETRKCTEFHGKSIRDGWYIEAEIESAFYEAERTDEEIAAQPSPGMIIALQTKNSVTQQFRIKTTTVKNGSLAFRADHVVYDAQYWPLATTGDLVLTEQDFGSFYLFARANANLLSDANSFIMVNRPSSITGTASKTYKPGDTLLDVICDCEDLFGIEWRPLGRLMIPIDPREKAVQGDLIYGRDIQSLRVDYDGEEICSRLYPYTSDGLRLASPGYIETGGTVTRCMAKEFDVPTEDSNGTAYTEAERQAILQQLAEAWATEHISSTEQVTVTGIATGTWTAGDLIQVQHPLVSKPMEVKSYTFDCQTGKVKKIDFGEVEYYSVKAALQKAAGTAQTAKEIASLDSRVTTLEQSGSGSGITLQDVIDAAAAGEIQPITFGASGSQQSLENGTSDTGLKISGEGRIRLESTDDTVIAKAGQTASGETRGVASSKLSGGSAGYSSSQMYGERYSGSRITQNARVEAKTWSGTNSDPAEATLEATDFIGSTGALVKVKADGTVVITAPAGLIINGSPYTPAAS